MIFLRMFVQIHVSYLTATHFPCGLDFIRKKQKPVLKLRKVYFNRKKRRCLFRSKIKNT